MSDTRLEAFLTRSRWFGGKGRTFAVIGNRTVVDLPAADGGPDVRIDLVELEYDDGTREHYQVPLAIYADAQEKLDHALIDEGPDGWLYDAVHDRAAMARVLAAFLDGSTDGFRLLPGHDIPADTPATPFSGEQSNSTVMYGEEAVLKFFRKVTPGENPDITTHKVLTDAGSTHVAHLYGWIEAGEDVSPLQLAMLQQFLRTATDGWTLAVTSVRDLFAEADLHAAEVGGDFASEAARLGEAVAEIHEQLRVAFPGGTVAGHEVADQMDQRLAAAIEVVPELAQHADRLRAAFAALRDLAEIPVQRIHSDLHLGQTLRTVAGWKLVDFEGEPAKPLEERLRPDSPWRDVAGMLRSFDYAPHAVVEASPEDDPDILGQRHRRAEEWAARNKQAFLLTYTGSAELTPEQGAMVAAYVADKCVYECVYEARNRPAWLSIPLAAIARIGVS